MFHPFTAPHFNVVQELSPHPQLFALRNALSAHNNISFYRHKLQLSH